MAQKQQKKDVDLIDMQERREQLQQEKHQLAEQITDNAAHLHDNANEAFTSEVGIPSSAPEVITGDSAPKFYALMQDNMIRLMEMQAELGCMLMKTWWSMPSFWSMTLNRPER